MYLTSNIICLPTTTFNEPNMKKYYKLSDSHTRHSRISLLFIRRQGLNPQGVCLLFAFAPAILYSLFDLVICRQIPITEFGTHLSNTANSASSYCLHCKNVMSVAKQSALFMFYYNKCDR